MAPSPGREWAQFSVLEDQFCKDFACCGINLENLHDLLQHFEENHVRVESDFEYDEDDDDLPFEFECGMDEDMDMDDVNDGPISQSHQHHAPFADPMFLRSQLAASLQAMGLGPGNPPTQAQNATTSFLSGGNAGSQLMTRNDSTKLTTKPLTVATPSFMLQSSNSNSNNTINNNNNASNQTSSSAVNDPGQSTFLSSAISFSNTNQQQQQQQQHPSYSAAARGFIDPSTDVSKGTTVTSAFDTSIIRKRPAGPSGPTATTSGPNASNMAGPEVGKTSSNGGGSGNGLMGVSMASRVAGGSSGSRLKRSLYRDVRSELIDDAPATIPFCFDGPVTEVVGDDEDDDAEDFDQEEEDIDVDIDGTENVMEQVQR
ncbi:hypothetical protein HDU76_008416, partial [Blyttiomyces sp. JEL0837]